MEADELLSCARFYFYGHYAGKAGERLTEKGMPHYGSPDKVPARRLETLRLAGEAAVPFTVILMGIAETRTKGWSRCWLCVMLITLWPYSGNHNQNFELNPIPYGECA